MLRKAGAIVLLLAATLTPAHGLAAHALAGSTEAALSRAEPAGALDEACEVCRAPRSGRAVVIEGADSIARIGEALRVTLRRGSAPRRSLVFSPEASRAPPTPC
jgi:hypothetical protein